MTKTRRDSPDDGGDAAEQTRARFVRRLEKLVRDARGAGVFLVVDADAIGVRVLTAAERAGAIDLRELGECVLFDDACGGGGAKVSGTSCNFGVS